MKPIPTWQEALGNSPTIVAAGAVGQAMQQEIDSLRTRVAELEKDAARLDWLNENIFFRENLTLNGNLHPTLNMWVTFAPKGVQGASRTIIDAAMGAQA